MGSLWRSQEMQLVQMFVQAEAAHDTVDELGELGLVQFVDLCPEVNAFQRNFVNEVKIWDEMERKVRFFQDQVEREKRDIEIEHNTEIRSLVQLDDDSHQERQRKEEESNKSRSELESEFEDLEKEIRDLNANQEKMSVGYNKTIEFMYVLMKDETFFAENVAGLRDSAILDDFDTMDALGGGGESKHLLGGGGLGGSGSAQQRAVKLGFYTGVIHCDKFLSFERVLWRSLRGNLFMKHSEIEEHLWDPSTSEEVTKEAFIIFYQGELAQQKIKKICESFGANLYPCPESSHERRELLRDVKEKQADMHKVLDSARKHRRRTLLDVARKLPQWIERVIKEKSIYHTLNMFNYDVGRKCLIAEAWCPTTATDKIVNRLRKATQSSGALVPSFLTPISSKEEPPTYFETNKFTGAFQAMIDAYGIARYREVNPTPLSIVTFPFLFAVMFGDAGHGFLMLLFSLWMVIREKQLGKQQLNEFIQTFYEGRYLILLMSIFSIYTGLLYNEVFSIPVNLFGSSWQFADTGNDTIAQRLPLGCEGPNSTASCDIYPFGVDPAWKGTVNSLTYYNSLKMKLSVLLGVLQMCVGIFISLLNGLHFKKPLDVWCQFLPQIIFMLSIFGYMCFLIVFKWFMPISAPHPSILNIIIDMFLSPVALSEADRIFSSGFWQLILQLFLIFIAVVSVPWMLIIKPLKLRRDHFRSINFKSPVPLHEEDPEEEEEEEEFDFGEIMVHQIIHTIEFILGCVSNTASYLRLWALSLAHAVLSEVFWTRVLLVCYEPLEFSLPLTVILVWVGFSIWAGATFGVLLMMESLSAFLHALRLHWVEFQSKFYFGDGTKFVPFSYEKILSGEEEEA